MQNCNEDMIFYVPVNSKLQHSPTGISHLNFPHPPFKHMLKCPIFDSYKVIKQPFSLSIVKKKYAYRMITVFSSPFTPATMFNWHDFSLNSSCVSISAISAMILIRVPLNFTQIHTHPSHTGLKSPPQFWATLSNSHPLRLNCVKCPRFARWRCWCSYLIDTLLTWNFTQCWDQRRSK